MSTDTTIEHVDHSLGIVFGCTKDCPHCWARPMCRFHAKPWSRGNAELEQRYRDFTPTVCWDKLNDLPTEMKRKPGFVFLGMLGEIAEHIIGSLANDRVDEFTTHAEAFVEDLSRMIRKNPMHTFLLLTHQYPARVYETMNSIKHFPPNVMLGVSYTGYLESKLLYGLWKCKESLPGIRTWVSAEPLTHEPICFDENRNLIGETIDWLVVGGMTGPKATEPFTRLAWVRNLRDIAVEQGIPFFFKSWGDWVPADNLDGMEIPPRVKRVTVDGVEYVHIGKKRAGDRHDLLDGQRWHQRPEWE